jgi:hypothetical protein
MNINKYLLKRFEKKLLLMIEEIKLKRHLPAMESMFFYEKSA